MYIARKTYLILPNSIPIPIADIAVTYDIIMTKQPINLLSFESEGNKILRLSERIHQYLLTHQVWHKYHLWYARNQAKHNS